LRDELAIVAATVSFHVFMPIAFGIKTALRRFEAEA
jgi:hypothetical protein